MERWTRIQLLPGFALSSIRGGVHSVNNLSLDRSFALIASLGPTGPLGPVKQQALWVLIFITFCTNRETLPDFFYPNLEYMDCCKTEWMLNVQGCDCTSPIQLPRTQQALLRMREFIIGDWWVDARLAGWVQGDMSLVAGWVGGMGIFT